MNNRDTYSINYKAMLVGALALFAPLAQAAAPAKPEGATLLQIQPNFKTLSQYNLTSVSEMTSTYPSWLANSTLEISGYDLTTEPHWSCTRKKKGATPGEICTTTGTRQIDEPGTKYFLKKINFKNPFQLLTNGKALGFEDPHTLLKNHYFLRWCQRNLAAITPNALFIVKHSKNKVSGLLKDDLFLASKQSRMRLWPVNSYLLCIPKPNIENA
jgi:hypothetical protein